MITVTKKEEVFQILLQLIKTKILQSTRQDFGKKLILKH